MRAVEHTTSVAALLLFAAPASEALAGAAISLAGMAGACVMAPLMVLV